MNDEEIEDVFFEIEEGDLVKVKYEGFKELSHEAEIVEGKGEQKVVSFLIPQTEPKLVHEYGKVRFEQRPLGKSREWSEYLSVDSLEIVSKD